MTSRVRRIFVVGCAFAVSVARGQAIEVGSWGVAGAPYSSHLTVVNVSNPARDDAYLQSARFRWSAAPCPASAEIRLYRLQISFHLAKFDLIEKRGPFDVRELDQAIGIVPLHVHPGDLIAITSVSDCGGPVGDASALGGTIGTTDPTVFEIFYPFGFETAPLPLVLANDQPLSPADLTLSFLGRRFVATLTAVDPRTGRTAAGHAVSLGDQAGYFSLPDLTGDPTFPEVMVKMADATRIASLNGMFWVFYSPLTDVSYSLTVRDVFTNRVRTYTNSSSQSGELCGGFDTSAFPP